MPKIQITPSNLSEMTGDFNIVVGRNAGGSLTTGCDNKFFGDRAGSEVSDANGLVIIGDDIPGLPTDPGTGAIVIGVPGHQVVIGPRLFGQPNPLYDRLRAVCSP